MNITNSSIQYISGNNVKTFKIPKKDRDINFKKWSYNDVIEYIKLNEKRREQKKGTKNSKNKNTIKYARLTTARNNPIINGKKTLEQVKLEAILAANNLGTNSTEYKTAIEQINQYTELILRKYLEDYIQKNPQTNTLTLGQLETKFNRIIGEKSNSFIKTPLVYQIINDNSSGMNKFRITFDFPDNKYTYNPGFKFGLQNRYKSTDDNKYYFGFKFPNDYDVDDIKDKMKTLIDMRKFKNTFYDFDDNKCVLTIDEIDDKRDELIDDHKYPVLLTDEDYAYICSDIFEYLLYNSNGQLRDKIYFCQYETFDMDNIYYVINSDIIDEHFIEYFMDNDISYKGKNTDMAFYSKVIDKLISLIGLNRGNYKDIYEYKDIIQSNTDFKDKFKDDDGIKKMEIEGEEKENDKERDRRERERIQKKIKDYQNELNNKDKKEDVEFNYKFPEVKYDFKEETEEEKQERDKRDRERMQKKIEDNRLGRYNNVIEEVKPVEPKPISPERIDASARQEQELEKETTTTTTENVEPIDENTDTEIHPVPPPKPKEKENTTIEPAQPPPLPEPPKIQKDKKPYPLNKFKNPDYNTETVIPDIKHSYACYLIYYINSKNNITIRGVILQNAILQTEIYSAFNTQSDNDKIKQLYIDISKPGLYKIIEDYHKFIQQKYNDIQIITFKDYEKDNYNQCEKQFYQLMDSLNSKPKYEIPNEEMSYYPDDEDDDIPDDIELLNNLDGNNKPLIENIIRTLYVVYHKINDKIEVLELVIADNNKTVEMRETSNAIIITSSMELDECYQQLRNLPKVLNEYNLLEQMNECVKVIRKTLRNKDIDEIKFVGISKDAYNTIRKKIITGQDVPSELEYYKIKVYKNNEGNGIYDNIKDFINFRKDTRKTLYYLLQRIITLENDMKTVKNKMVSNDIRTNLNNHNIKYGDEDDEDFDTSGNGFTCSRCGMINPKFFKNDYPTLSEFREQFSKL